jgi:hypothetical protein
MTEEQNEEHLVELRSRLFKIFGAVFLVFIALLPFAKIIFNYVAEPLVNVVPEGELLALSPVSPLTATIALTFYIALFLAMPVILYQIWAFVAPGLYRQEKRFTFPLLATSIMLFFVGMAFAYYVVFPLIFGFVSTFTDTDRHGAAGHDRTYNHSKTGQGSPVRVPRCLCHRHAPDAARRHQPDHARSSCLPFVRAGHFDVPGGLTERKGTGRGAGSHTIKLARSRAGSRSYIMKSKTI